MDFKYPYTDFHELNLDWFLAEFKKLTAEWLQVQHDWEDEQQAFQDLHDYVQNYFANLNLYQEVHDILYSPEMQQSIQLMLSNITNSLLPTVVANQIASVVAAQLAPVVAAQLPNLLNSMLPSLLPAAVAGEAAAWLADNVDPDTGYVIDESLTIRGAAADAKMTGDSIHSSSLITNVYQGGIQNGNAYINNLAFSSDATLIRSCDTGDVNNIFIPANTRVYITCNAAYKYAYQLYNVNTGNHLETFTWHTTTTENLIETVDAYMVLMIARVDGANIDVSEMSNIFISTVPYVASHEIDKLQDEIDSINSIIPSLVVFPFTFNLGVSVFKDNDKYTTDFKPQSKMISNVNGVVVFMSPDGNDTNNGLSVLTPKKTLAAALAVSNVNTLIMLEGTYQSGVHFTAGMQITQAVNIIGVGNVIIDNIDDRLPLRFYRSLYCENIHFKHGKNTVSSTLDAADRIACFYKCKFSESNKLNGLAVEGGTCYVVECEAYGNAYDGFNYHRSNSYINNCIEIDCLSYNNGTYDLNDPSGQSSNASTSHDNSYIVRINGEYYACHGGVVADKDCNTANYGCRAGISTITDISYPDRMSNYWCSGGTMYLYDCISYGSKYDTAVVNGGTIITDTTYPNIYT